MPSGRTHDRITLWSLPLVAGMTFTLTESDNLTLIVCGAFLFSGLMFGPDLDLHSRPYRRWGLVRWIWIPYQKMVRHRSVFSHGPVIGTALRVLYLCIWVGIPGVFVLEIAQLVWGLEWSWQSLAQSATLLLTHYANGWIALYLGLELGAMLHSLSDWGSSVYKSCNQQRKRSSLPRAKIVKKRKQSRSVKLKSRQKH